MLGPASTQAGMELLCRLPETLCGLEGHGLVWTNSLGLLQESHRKENGAKKIDTLLLPEMPKSGPESSPEGEEVAVWIFLAERFWVA